MSIFKLDLQFFAKHGGGGSASTNCSHDSNSKSLGVKKFGGERVKGGEIIVRQHGSKFLVGAGAYFGRDYTIHALWDGLIKYYYRWKRGKKRTVVSVLPVTNLGEKLSLKRKII